MASLYHSLVLQALAAYISEHRLLRPGDRLCIAVSGGADSVALLRALVELREQMGLVLSAAHLHHGIRGSDADRDESFVRQLAGQLKLHLYSERVDAPAYASEHRLSLETAGRKLRYEFFHRLLSSGEVDKIATAHTLDDQAETVLLRLLRGTGTRGLAGILPMRKFDRGQSPRIIRPLLGIPRTQIESYLHSLDQPWCEDSTNTDLKHLRNRVRHDLLPLLEHEYNPNIRELLANLAEIARVEEEVWEARTAGLLEEIATLDDTGARVCREKLLTQPLALQRRVLGAILERLGISSDFCEIDDLLRTAGEKGSRKTLAGGWEAAVIGDSVVIRQLPADPAPPEYVYQLPVPGTLEIPETGHILRTWMRDSCSGAVYNPATSLAWERLTLPLGVRNWRPGDRYWPWGGKQPEKLKRLFQQKRILSPARSRWPVVLSGETIIWVPGFPVAHDFAAKSGPAVCIEAVARD